MSFTLKDVDAAELRIRAKVPNVRTARFDYGFGLSAAVLDLDREVVIFQPQRDDNDQEEITTPIDDAIAFLKGK